MTSDAELLRRFANEGDEPAFTELVQRQVNLVYSAALRQVGGDSHLAEDVTQGVFLALARSASRLRDRPVLTGWLYTTTRFLAAKAVRSQKRWQRREQEAQTMHESLSNSPPGWTQLRPVLDEAMHELGKSDCEALLLRYFEGQSFSEVGLRCGLSENSARMRVERALEKLRQRLMRRGITSTTAALGTVLAQQTVSAAPAGLAAAAAAASLAGLAGSVGATAAMGIMQLITKQNVVAMLGVALLSTGIYLVSENRLEARLAADELQQNQELVRWRSDNQRLRTENQRAVAALAASPSAPPAIDPLERLHALADILRSGALAGVRIILYHPVEEAPDRFRLPPAVNAALIDLFKLSAGEATALNTALDTAEHEISALAVVSAVVTHSENQIQIDIPTLSAAGESYARMQAAFRQILGEERYALYDEIGWAQTVRNCLRALGLDAHSLIIWHNPNASDSAAPLLGSPGRRENNVPFANDRVTPSLRVVYTLEERSAPSVVGISGGAGGGGGGGLGDRASLKTNLGPFDVLIPADF